MKKDDVEVTADKENSGNILIKVKDQLEEYSLIAKRFIRYRRVKKRTRRELSKVRKC